MQSVKLALLQGKRNGIIKSFCVDKVCGEIFATAYYKDGEVNMFKHEGKYAVYEPLNGKTAIYGTYDTIGKAVQSMLKGTFKCRKAKLV